MKLLNDYFTVQEFRDITGDKTSPYRYEDADILRAQDEVITTLESWAGSAWPTVAASRGQSYTTDAFPEQIIAVGGPFGTAGPTLIQVGDELRVERADGANFPDQYVTVTVVISQSQLEVTPDINLVDPPSSNVCNVYKASDTEAIGPRVATEDHFQLPLPVVTLDNTPALQVLQPPEIGYTDIGSTQDFLDGYFLDTDIGAVKWGRSVGGYPPSYRFEPLMAKLTVVYQYGYIETPWAVKRPCIKSTKTLLDQDQNRGGKVPRNVSRYETEKTTFDFGKKPGRAKPWPWDPIASDDINGYWDDYKPTEFSIV